MKWREISKERPPHGELIWVYNVPEQKKLLYRYLGDEESWLLGKDRDKNFPIWAPLNEDDDE